MNIYVGNLSYDVSENELQQIFGDYGEVTSVKVVSDHQSGRSKGFAFVEMADSGAAETAIAELNGRDIKGRALRVSEARPKESGGGGGGGGGRGGPRFRSGGPGGGGGGGGGRPPRGSNY